MAQAATILLAAFLGGTIMPVPDPAAPIPAAQNDATSGMNLLLPEGMQPDAAKSLAQQLVDALEAHPVTGPALERARKQGGAPSARGALILSGEGRETLVPGVPSLNEFIGVLTVPMGRDVTREAVQNAIRGVPGADRVQVDPVESFGILPGEESR
jgi:hypothetical protein